MPKNPFEANCLFSPGVLPAPLSILLRFAPATKLPVIASFVRICLNYLAMSSLLS
jgi:hypothetical protein